MSKRLPTTPVVVRASRPEDAEAMIAILIIGILVDSLVFGTADRAVRSRYGLIDAAAG